MRDVLIVFLILLYNISLVAATGYLVFFRDASGWWFLLTLLLMVTVHEGIKKK